MLAVIITLGVVIFVAVVAFALIAGRKGRVAVETASPARPVGPKRVFDEPVVAAPATRETPPAPAETEAAAGPVTIEAAAPAAAVAAFPPRDSAALDRAVAGEPPATSATIAGPPPAPGWYAAFDKRSQDLDDTARLRLIGDLGVIASAWCVPLLCQAYEQERRPANRQAALTALAACRNQGAASTYRLALASGDAAEAAIAADALADLEPPAASRQRTVVERR